MQLKQQSLEQWGQRRASRSFSMQMKQRNTSAMLCTGTEERLFFCLFLLQSYFMNVNQKTQIPRKVECCRLAEAGRCLTACLLSSNSAF